VLRIALQLQVLFVFASPDMCPWLLVALYAKLYLHSPEVLLRTQLRNIHNCGVKEVGLKPTSTLGEAFPRHVLFRGDQVLLAHDAAVAIGAWSQVNG
jgi:hypothetical protein